MGADVCGWVRQAYARANGGSARSVQALQGLTFGGSGSGIGIGLGMLQSQNGAASSAHLVRCPCCACACGMKDPTMGTFQVQSTYGVISESENHSCICQKVALCCKSTQ